MPEGRRGVSGELFLAIIIIRCRVAAEGRGMDEHNYEGSIIGFIDIGGLCVEFCRVPDGRDRAGGGVGFVGFFGR